MLEHFQPKWKPVWRPEMRQDKRLEQLRRSWHRLNCSKATALMLADLGGVKSHSRPHTSNDNPFSEAQVKTLKYQPEFPKRFQTIDEARALCRRFFARYNQDHHHAGIGLMTPDQIHFGQADALYAARQNALDAAFLSTPERFVRQRPKPPQIPNAVWINPPKNNQATQA